MHPVVDFALRVDIVDPKRNAIYGWSLGGYLSPRAASRELRIAACIADPGRWGPAQRQMLLAAGWRGAEADDPKNLDDAVFDLITQNIEKSPKMRWSVIQRGLRARGVKSVREYFDALAPYTLEGLTGKIRCPTLLTVAENDPLAALQCPKTLVRSSAAEGAGEHCEMRNRSLLNRRVLDWLDVTFRMTLKAGS